MENLDSAELQKLGILHHQSVQPSKAVKGERKLFASYFKAKADSSTAPRLNTRLVKMPDRLL